MICAFVASVAATFGVVSACRALTLEVRMSAGPTVRLNAGGHGGYEVAVTWGSQYGTLTARTLESAIECVRLAYAFYQMRDAKMIQD